MHLRKLSILFLIIGNLFLSCASADKKSSIVIDYNNKHKVVFSENADELRHPASLTKVMTIYLLFEALKMGKISLNTKFKVSKFASGQMPSKLGLKVGDTISVSDIIKSLIVKSANDVAVVAAEGISGSVLAFANLMNKKALKLGMKRTHFENSSGVPNKKQITTARDMAILGMSIYSHFPQYWHYFSLKTFKYKNTVHQTHCKIMRWYKGADGAKTGYICASGFNLIVTAKKYNKNGDSKRIFTVVLGRESAKARDLYAAKLLDKYLKDYKIVSSSPSPKKHEEEIQYNTKSMLKILDNREENDEAILQEEEEINIDSILDYSLDEKKFIKNLYVDDDEQCDIVEEEHISASPRKSVNRKFYSKKNTKKHGRKKNKQR